MNKIVHECKHFAMWIWIQFCVDKIKQISVLKTKRLTSRIFVLCLGELQPEHFAVSLATRAGATSEDKLQFSFRMLPADVVCVNNISLLSVEGTGGEYISFLYRCDSIAAVVLVDSTATPTVISCTLTGWRWWPPLPFYYWWNLLFNIIILFYSLQIYGCVYILVHQPFR